MNREEDVGMKSSLKPIRQKAPDLNLLPEIFARRPEILAVYLFGSTASGAVHAESDLDLALVLRPGVVSFPKLDLLADLAQAGFCNVDLVALNTDDIVLEHEAVRQHRLLYQTEGFDSGAFFSEIIRKFLDFRPYLDVQRQAYKKGLRMVRAEVLHRRLTKLDEYLAILRQMQRYSRQEFINNPERYGSAERFLQLAIETLTDLGAYVVADFNLGSVDWYSDVPRRLREGGYIDLSTEQTWIRIIGFRNVLVHEYLDIDREIVYQVLQENLDDLEKLKTLFLQFL